MVVSSRLVMIRNGCCVHFVLETLIVQVLIGPCWQVIPLKTLGELVHYVYAAGLSLDKPPEFADHQLCCKADNAAVFAACRAACTGQKDSVVVQRAKKEGSFGLEVSGGQRKFPGGQNCSKTSLGSRLKWQAEALRARIDS